jgi:hypothetical protein
VLRVVGGFVLLSDGLLLLAARASPCPCCALLAGYSAYAWGAIVVGALGLVTGITGFCVLYVPFGISTVRSTFRAAR